MSRWRERHEKELADFNAKNELGAVRDAATFEWTLTDPEPAAPYDVLFVLPLLGIYGGVAAVLELANALVLQGVRRRRRRPRNRAAGNRDGALLPAAAPLGGRIPRTLSAREAARRHRIPDGRPRGGRRGVPRNPDGLLRPGLRRLVRLRLARVRRADVRPHSPHRHDLDLDRARDRDAPRTRGDPHPDQRGSRRVLPAGGPAGGSARSASRRC